MLIVCSTFCSCTNDGPKHNADDSLLSGINEFLNSEYGIATLENHMLKVSDLDLANSKSEFIKSKGVTAFAVPFKKNGKVIGKLTALIVPGNEPYRAIVENWERTSTQDYSVIVTTGCGEYLATVNVAHDGDKTTQNIVDVASTETSISRSSRPPRPGKESWLECTARVYHIAKQACQNDSQCDFLCDIANLARGCTITLAAAAAIACM